MFDNTQHYNDHMLRCFGLLPTKSHQRYAASLVYPYDTYSICNIFVSFAVTHSWPFCSFRCVSYATVLYLSMWYRWPFCSFRCVSYATVLYRSMRLISDSFVAFGVFNNRPHTMYHVNRFVVRLSCITSVVYCHRVICHCVPQTVLVNFTYLGSNIPESPAYGVSVHGWYVMPRLRLCSSTVTYDWLPVIWGLNRDWYHMWGRKCSLFPEHLISLPLTSS